MATNEFKYNSSNAYEKMQYDPRRAAMAGTLLNLRVIDTEGREIGVIDSINYSVSQPAESYLSLGETTPSGFIRGDAEVTLDIRVRCYGTDFSYAAEAKEVAKEPEEVELPPEYSLKRRMLCEE